ncbi:CTL-like protein 2 [Rhopalosiphum maidis]|uniref:CTL-like protein 2 n=1 Tax=Rhopalosiphum maidis TaxID=43146 RepID=UPI000EFE32EA|nr:CTL-like protein 2 [Rhopalosiphum maidis]XP_026811385.1 CTL-like protein 2 [Rhopalosiphum maidis]XP_026811386.1 CTL-like protein 2 [Rhopalosiphum maidis]XP_026811387.1 CTL-like protein 2 [Rhopalosiphum maidis]XP_026811388.1 CTL-like protein 2 [Rhopalosiphum maidis]XP_026811389.1 CTL-like protein 2 [Rhopalosiphum maidis]XP_026811390.1 CTL-like protein 2 [Rhopalosiphum maidis]XP_026811391.1 CTL-like protein 2 [Rhopalosiphum maidis]
MDQNSYSPNRKKPLEKRSCTDCLCFIGFSLFIACWVALASYAYQNSDLELSPSDSNGQVCGRNKNVSKNPYLFFFDITECTSPMIFVHRCQTPQVCVENCPNTDWSVKEVLDTKDSQVDWPAVQKALICVSPDLNKLVNSKEVLKNFTSSNQCAKYYTKSENLFNYCIPTLSGDPESLKQILNSNNIMMSNFIDGTTMVDWLKVSKETSLHIIEDLEKSYEHIFVGLLIAIFFSLTYILLLRWFSWIMVWMSLWAIVGLLGFGSYESYARYVAFGDADPVSTMTEDGEPTDIATGGGRQSWSNYANAKLNKKSTWLVFTIVSTVALVVLLLIIIFLRKRIRLSIALIVEGSRAILEIKTSLAFPIFQWLLYLVVLIWFFGVAIYLSSMKLYVFKVKGLANDHQCVCNNSYYKDGDWCTESKWEWYCSATDQNNTMCKFAKCAYDHSVSQDFITGLQLFNVFGMLWLMNFVSAFSQMVLAITFTSWYWTFHKRDLPFFSLTSSFYKTIRYHLGTVAYGSLIIAICNFIRAILEWVETKLKKYDNSFTRAIFTCMRCFFWLLNKFLRFVNRNAYIMCAMYGKNFCTSAKQAFDLLLRNVMRLVVLDKVTDFIFFVGKIVIMGTTIAAFYFGFYEPLEPIRKFEFFNQPVLNYKWLPMVIIAASSWVISSTFFHVYSIAVDTLFLCFLEDSERNDGSADRPYFMSRKLMNILGTKNVL